MPLPSTSKYEIAEITPGLTYADSTIGSSKMSDASPSVTHINIPECKNFTAKFKYNFYQKTETVEEYVPPVALVGVLDKLPRYVELAWQPPGSSLNDAAVAAAKASKEWIDLITPSPLLTSPGLIKANAESNRINSENNYVNPGFISHTFSDVSAIEQGSADMENYSRITNSSAESLYKMAKEQSEILLKVGEKAPDFFKEKLTAFTDAYSTLADLPTTSLGLRVIGSKDTEDDSTFLRTILSNVSLNVKINSKVTNDVFRNSMMSSTPINTSALEKVHAESSYMMSERKASLVAGGYVDGFAIKTERYDEYRKNVYEIVGYIIDRYVSTPSGLVKNKTFYLDGSSKNSLVDTSVLYGSTYFYAINVIAAVRILTYSSSADGKPALNTFFISSQPASVAVECFEHTPPPEPDDVEFLYDYSKNSIILHWRPPVNPQADIRQYQVFRRKSVTHPFELIAMLSFDNSSKKYTTGERVDGNKEDVESALQPLIVRSDYESNVYEDQEFVIDSEMQESSDYIYAICSVDAHGMISNYSTQYRVYFDFYKNKLIPKIICDKGSPKPYPNMNMRLDVFKDVIHIEGQEQREMRAYFTPEYLRLADQSGNIRDVVKFKRPDKPTEDPHYLLQLINLDNKKMQMLKITINDDSGLTIPASKI